MYTSTLYMLELSNDLIHAPLRTSGLTDHAPVVAAHDVVHLLAEPRGVAELEHKPRWRRCAGPARGAGAPLHVTSLRKGVLALALPLAPLRLP